MAAHGLLRVVSFLLLTCLVQRCRVLRGHISGTSLHKSLSMPRSGPCFAAVLRITSLPLRHCSPCPCHPQMANIAAAAIVAGRDREAPRLMWRGEAAGEDTAA